MERVAIGRWGCSWSNADRSAIRPAFGPAESRRTSPTPRLYSQSGNTLFSNSSRARCSPVTRAIYYAHSEAARPACCPRLIPFRGAAPAVSQQRNDLVSNQTFAARPLRGHRPESGRIVDFFLWHSATTQLEHCEQDQSHGDGNSGEHHSELPAVPPLGLGGGLHLLILHGLDGGYQLDRVSALLGHGLNDR